MSNLDTTLREKFNKQFPCSHHPAQCDGDCMKEYADWWLAEFHKLMNEKREAIEGMRIKWNRADFENEPFHPVATFNTGHNAALDDVLSILED